MAEPKPYQILTRNDLLEYLLVFLPDVWAVAHTAYNTAGNIGAHVALGEVERQLRELLEDAGRPPHP
jgi:hypothetical protein